MNRRGFFGRLAGVVAAAFGLAAAGKSSPPSSPAVIYNGIALKIHEVRVTRDAIDHEGYHFVRIVIDGELPHQATFAWEDTPPEVRVRA